MLTKEEFLNKLKTDKEFNKKFGRKDGGDLGPVYGKQWVNRGGYHSSGHWNSETNGLGKDWEGINQIQNVIDTLKTNPDSRRMIVSAWNVSDLVDLVGGVDEGFVIRVVASDGYSQIFERSKVYPNSHCA